MRLNQKILSDITIYIFIFFFSFSVNYYYGFLGITPLDDFLNYNCGFRILNGDIPFKDYYSITGFFLCKLQSIFYLIFGINWTALVVHASIFNSILCLLFYFFLKKFELSNILSFIFCLSLAILAYPNNGVPGVDHHSWILSISSFLLFYLGMVKNNKIYLICSTLFLFCAFIIKQVPAAYFLILILFLYFKFSIINKKILFFNELFLSVLFCLLILFIFIKINTIELNIFWEQYFILPLNLGSERFEKIDLSFVIEKISNIYFLIFLIFPFLINFLETIKNNKDENSIINILIGFFLILMSLFYEIHTNNSAMTFIILPITIFFLFQVQKFYNENKQLKWIYFILIFYSWFRLMQFEIFSSLIDIIIIINFITFMYFKKKKIITNQNLLIIYLIFSSIYYFQTSVDSRKYKDINISNKISFDGSKINKKFQNVKWITHYNSLETEEVHNFNLKLDYLKNLKANYIMVTDYQIYTSILNHHDYSPVKYWHTNVSYPGKDSIFRNKFENFFKEKILRNEIKYILIDDKASLFQETIDDYSFLLNCYDILENGNHKILNVYKLDLQCIKQHK